MKKILVLLLALFSLTAYSAQDSTVIEDNAPVMAEPSHDNKTVIDYFPVGAEVRISSYPMPGGWYKVRARNGMYGWIHESSLSVEKMGDLENQEKEETPQPEADRQWVIRGFGGFDFFSPRALNEAYLFEELNTGYHLGGEIGYFLSERFMGVVRAEAITKNVVAKENVSNVTFNLGIRSYPIMGGVDFYFAKTAALRFSLGLLAGIGASTSFSSEAINLSQPNAVTLKATPFTTYARANIVRPLGRLISIFGEVGYRYLQTNRLSTVNDSNGGGVFVRDNVFVSREINLSGFVVAAGVGVHF